MKIRNRVGDRTESCDNSESKINSCNGISSITTCEIMTINTKINSFCYKCSVSPYPSYGCGSGDCGDDATETGSWYREEIKGGE